MSFHRIRAIAERLSQNLAETALERDRQGGTAKLERDQIRASGLLASSIPTSYGGHGASWLEIMQLVRLISSADSSLGHLFGFHHLLVATVRLFGTQQQWETAYGETASQNLFWGNALNPLDPGTTLTRSDRGLVIDGKKSFCSGALDSDRLIVSANDSATGKLVVAALPSNRAGIRYNQDWDNLGQRQTDSGSVELSNVLVHESELLTSPGPLGSPFASLRPCIAQLVLGNVYLGIAQGALAAAKPYTHTQRRAWPASGVTSASEDPYVLARYGEFSLQIESARLLADAAASALDAAWDEKERVTPEARGRAALAIAAAKVATTRASLDVSARIFDVMGARSTTAKLRLDRFFRNARTHTLHDPVDYKIKELGEWELSGKLPVPSFYS
ncbi:MAG TPA: acyl-CoA dehydrogenase family protein [Polyangiaceae bacterium]|nr:acyl-CoA dehydrogenase family protein [Polyangiaceae bacterium]